MHKISIICLFLTVTLMGPAQDTLMIRNKHDLVKFDVGTIDSMYVNRSRGNDSLFVRLHEEGLYGFEVKHIDSIFFKTSPRNLIFNGSFEAGPYGYELNKFLRIDKNPGLEYEGPIIDSTDSGNWKLCIPNRYSEACELFARSVRLKPGITYSVSLNLRTSGGTAVVTSLIASTNWDVHGETFLVDKTWKRYSYSFSINQENPEEYAPYLRLNWSQTDTARFLWIDDYQIIEGSENSFFPSAELEISTTAEKALLVEGEDSAAISTTLFNSSKRIVKGEIEYDLEEDDGLPATTIKKLYIEIQPGERSHVNFKIPVDRYASFTVNPRTRFNATVATIPAWFAKVGKLDTSQAPIDVDKTFCVSTNMEVLTAYCPRSTDSPYMKFRGSSGSLEDLLSLYSLMGGRMVRSWDFHWGEIEPEKGQYQWDITDLLVDRMLAHGITPVPIVGQSFLAPVNDSFSSPESWPTWLLESCIKINTPQPYSGQGLFSFVPQPVDWNNYIQALVSRFRGRISHWEIMNEPNIWMGNASESHKLYQSYLNSAWQTIHTTNPNAKVLGFCATGDLGGDMGSFLDSCFKNGGLNFADAVTFHPYASRSLGSSIPADSTISSIRKLTARYGKPAMPVWNSELYYLSEFGNSHRDGFYGQIRPYHVARRFLTDLGEGLAQSCSIDEGSGLWKKTLNPGFLWSTHTSRWMPSSIYVTYNALARFFEGARVLTKIHWGPNTVCYVYEKDGKPIAAAWEFRPGKGQRIDLPPEIDGTRVLDVFGNAVGTGTITVGQVPQYLVPAPGINADVFIETLQTSGAPQIEIIPSVADSIGQRVKIQVSVLPWPGYSISRVLIQCDDQYLGDAIKNDTTHQWEFMYAVQTYGGTEISAIAIDDKGNNRAGSARVIVGSLGTFGNDDHIWEVPKDGVLHLEAEYFDQGGEGAGFHDDTPDIGSWHVRSNGAVSEVDIFDDGNEGPSIGSSNPGEWLRYSVMIPATGTYHIRLRYANGRPEALPKALTVKWKNQIVAGEVGMPVTLLQHTTDDRFTTFRDLDIIAFLNAGTGFLQIDCLDWGTRWNWIEIWKE